MGTDVRAWPSLSFHEEAADSCLLKPPSSRAGLWSQTDLGWNCLTAVRPCSGPVHLSAKWDSAGVCDVLVL